MKDISHREAVKLIHLRLDGLLNDSQSRSLNEHLDTCDSCQTYAAEMELVPAHLQREFHLRWDQDLSPSHRVLQQVTSKAKRIPVANRITSSIRLMASGFLVAFLILGINYVILQMKSTPIDTIGTQSVSGSELINNRLIAFTSEKDGNFDIYTMYADGSGLTNITNNSAFESSPFWSPDGKRIAFESGRDGSWAQIYLMNADGSNVVQLTDDQADHQFIRSYGSNSSPWSPDGNKLILSQKLPGEEKWTLFTLDANGGNKIPLVSEPNIYNAISWSPDGRQIAFTKDDPQNLGGSRLYVVNADGSNYREITNFFQQNEQLSHHEYRWSSNGESIFFISFLQKTNPKWTAYEFNLSSNTPVEKTTTPYALNDWQNGTLFVTSFQTGSPFKWMRSDGTDSTLYPYKNCEQVDAYLSGSYIKRSPNGNWVMNAYCPNGDFWFYYANSDGTLIEQLLNSPISARNNDLIGFEWSPDDKFIAFNMASSDKSDLYIFDVSEALKDPSLQPVKMTNSYGASWQPVVNNNIAEKETTPEPTQTYPSDRLLAFTSNQDGNTEIYTIRADGSELTNITNNPASDVNPVWSPDGMRIAFGSDRDGGDYSQIFLMDADGSDTTQLTTDEGNHLLPLMLNGKTSLWSPDGSKLLYMRIGYSDVEWTLQSIDINNGGITSLGTGKVDINHISWSPNGKHIAFVRNDPKNTDDNKFVPQIQVVRADGTNLTTITSLLPADEALNVPINYYWSRDGQSIFLIASNMDPENTASENYTWKVYEASMDGTLTLHATTHSPIGGWWDGNYFITPIMGSGGWTWVHPDGSVNTINPTKECEQERLYDAGTNSYTSAVANFSQSPNGNGLIIASCPDGNVHLSRVNSIGMEVTPIAKLSTTSPEYLEWVLWSQDDTFIAYQLFTPGTTDIYLLNIAESLKDPSIQPVKISQRSDFPFTLNWQPVVSNQVTEKESTPEPPQTSASDNLIAFTADNNNAANINMDIYTIHPDGSNLTNLTHDQAKDFNANDYNPEWSPDRKKIAFMSERGGNMIGNANIFVMNSDGNELTQLTYHPGNDAFLSWSPNGQQIVYYSSPNGEANDKGQLIIMDADGSDKTILTTLGYYYFQSWSPDNQKIVYVKPGFDGASYKDAGIYVVGIDGKNGHEWFTDNIDQIRWEDSEHFLGVVQTGKDAQSKWSLYRFSTDGSQIEVASHNAPIVAIFERSYVVEGQDGLTWFALEGAPISLSPWNVAEKCETTGNSYLSTSHIISSDQKHALAVIYCKETTWYFLENEEGSEIQQLGAPIEGSFGMLPHWSPDGNYVSLFFTNRKGEDLYLIDIQKMLNDPSATPILLATNVLAGVGTVEPLIASNDNEEKPTPEPLAFSLSVYEAEKLAFFDIFEPSYLPAGYALEGVAYNPLTQQVAMKYISQQGNSSLIIYQQRGDLLHYPDLRGYTTPVSVGDIEAEYIQGAWIYESPDAMIPTWDPRADSYSLTWQDEEFIFSINFIGGETITPLQLNELVAIAESLK